MKKEDGWKLMSNVLLWVLALILSPLWIPLLMYVAVLVCGVVLYLLAFIFVGVCAILAPFIEVLC